MEVLNPLQFLAATVLEIFDQASKNIGLYKEIHRLEGEKQSSRYGECIEVNVVCSHSRGDKDFESYTQTLPTCAQASMGDTICRHRLFPDKFLSEYLMGCLEILSAA